jgi:hypothetical protein
MAWKPDNRPNLLAVENLHSRFKALKRMILELDDLLLRGMMKKRITGC